MWSSKRKLAEERQKHAGLAQHNAVKCTTFSDEILQSNSVKISLGM
jgi:hypothetical protein